MNYVFTQRKNRQGKGSFTIAGNHEGGGGSKVVKDDVKLSGGGGVSQS